MICHIPPANAKQLDVIIADAAKAAAHLAHGDTLGDCLGAGDVQIQLID